MIPPADEPSRIVRITVNCATTCNTGHRRSPEEPPCRRPARHKKSFSEETGEVWTEAGFLPPASYRQAVTLLHRLAMEEEPAASLLSNALTAAGETSGPHPGARGSYRILDSGRLRRIAEEYGIEPAGRDDDEIAHAVTLAIIGEYREKIPEERA
nr:hypothetical protein [Methanoculleus sp. 7T]